jgi:hypothetical protein
VTAPEPDQDVQDLGAVLYGLHLDQPINPAYPQWPPMTGAEYLALPLHERLYGSDR